ncbi:MAG: NAD(P)H-hydrate dehydratase [Spirochaetaceae bacterium]|nr:MAG: NAD(P)H-hydrate dehydratase [Spirochaetaceae bacterium]
MYAVPDSAEMSDIDLESQEKYGISGLLLMENAARSLLEGLVQFVREQGYTPESVRIMFVAGPGNNGGDALALARMWLCLAGGSPQLLLTAEPKPGSSSAVHLEILRRLGVPIHWDAGQESEAAQVPAGAESEAARLALESAQVIVDGVFGTGLRGSLHPAAVSLLERINRAPACRVSIDIPSGVSDDFRGDRVAVAAQLTLAVELPKLCYYTELARPLCGSIRMVPLGFPPALIQAELSAKAVTGAELSTHGRRAVLLEAKDLAGFVPDFDAYAHKYQRGALAVFAGSEEYPGAAVMACNAALRSRAGYVQLFSEAAALQRMTSLDPAVVASNSGVGDKAPVAAEFRTFKSAIVGPGWGRAHDRVEQLQRLLRALPPGVIDADGLFALGRLLGESAFGSESPVAGWILTPHHGEFERLGFGPVPPDAASRRAMLAECSASLGAVVVLKGPVTWIMAPDGRCAVYDGADPLLAAGGSGDILCGCIGSFRAGGAEAFEAACAGVLTLAAAAQAARNRYGVFSPGDLPPEIGRVIAAAKSLRFENDSDVGKRDML